MLLVFIPVLFFLILETGLRLFNYGGNPLLFVSTPYEASIYYGINLKVGKRYFHRSDFNPTPRKDIFLKEKPKNGFRIFVLGESTTAGFPYGNNLTFTRVLNRRLSDTFPSRRIEVVNTAMTASNSYALLDFMDEVLKYKPDGILIYTGHNEYYGALGVGSTESLGKNQFRYNLHDVLRKAKDAGVPVLIGELVSNIRDQKSFVSVLCDTFPGADEVIAEARQLEKEGHIPQARKAYYRAKDLDALRFRAPEEFNQIIRDLAHEFSISVVPMDSCFEAASPNRRLKFSFLRNSTSAGWRFARMD
ncbi:SGNH/GDSL hydrolase family protein [candidate division KSB1 bacterium]|nr:SGNH/GDSL hydrolase family protein [candidate division KSB1 bacterium]